MINVKAKGSRVERNLVDKMEAHGIRAKRAWGSNGESLGFPPEVDVLLQDIGMGIQVKARKAIPSYIERGMITALRPDREPFLFVIPEALFIVFIKAYENYVRSTQRGEKEEIQKADRPAD
jgi:hypothetical protein